MNSVTKFTASSIAALAALAFVAPQASAADLGGNCCADLEERIAELEATTARKGNRKVSLTISGWVNEVVEWWDDGNSESNVYVGTNALEQSRVKFVGEAKISDGWSAGYTLELGLQGSPSNKWDQTTPRSSDTTSPENFVLLRASNWWIKSKDWGKLAVGLQGTATYHLLDDADGANTRYYSDAQAPAVAMGRFFVKGQTGLRWSDILRGPDNATPGQDGRRSVVRYDSPTIAGFTLTTSWGEDDNWGTTLTYKNDIGDFALIGKVGYEENTDEGTSTCHTSSTTSTQDCQWWGVAGTIMHKPTGLYVYGAYGRDHDSRRDEAVPLLNKALVDKDDEMWYVQAGIEQKWHPIGKTTIFGEYRQDNAGSNVSGTGTLNTLGADVNFWAGGVVQNIEAAAMDLYVIYRRADGDVARTGVGNDIDIDGFSMVMGGARLQF